MKRMEAFAVGVLLLACFLWLCVSAHDLSLADMSDIPSMSTNVSLNVPVSPVSSLSTRTMPTVTPTVVGNGTLLPDGLGIVYTTHNTLWLWTSQGTKLLLQRQGIFAPTLSDDGKWLIFWQEDAGEDEYSVMSREVWLMRTDGSELRRLLGTEDLTTFARDGASLIVNAIDWLPGDHRLLFDTKKIVEGPPEIWPTFDLYSIDLSGHIIQLADAGEGGHFNPAPGGEYVAVASDSEIRILDTKTGMQVASFAFEPFWMGCECAYVPEVVWDTQGRYIMTSIPPQKLFYPDYAGEPEEVWRVYANDDAELVAQIQPFSQQTVRFSPDLHYILYLDNGCVDGMGKLSIHNLLMSGEDISLFCTWELPEWTPDSEHFIYELDGVWRVSSIYDTTGRPLSFLNTSTVPNTYMTPQIQWINNTYFLLTLQGQDVCTLSIATLNGIVTEITRTSLDACPQADFGFLE